MALLLLRRCGCDEHVHARRTPLPNRLRAAGTLPVTTKCAIDSNNVHPAIARFVLPLGATINMDGSAIGFPCRVFFVALAQGTWTNPSPADLFTTALISTLMSIGAAPIPNAGLVLLTLILNTWIPDRLETITNVTGDSLACVIINHRYRKAVERSVRLSQHLAAEAQVSRAENTVAEASKRVDDVDGAD
ncbi:hypothetical protein EMIHUDRAFT_218272 [Emiliania huxleyi CCMP1516]|uniref:Amino acid transporter n=2 Tax=Emiliania huxleyi TaxID=2903 RepID=A0A0D3I8Z2_EMIH1|nr:hypothetical protein EMIHUDRAFT_218272 [Emiliania huxleyi CCMP1516]EOD07727.1 hypothetical protein EMIHUDRAFT_218272 [Emiliania huxleyi CCMP1516]|eukprot:XP_005760156.1 hypothetical protein EMIHUDRAFT_218272 [Emiliania huxleyi CCMP1516]